jgi:hypothetical protein
VVNVPPRPVESLPPVPADELTETVILPYLDAPITTGTNLVYCATFQLAWNELRDRVIGGAIQLEGGPAWTSLLNEGTFSRSDLSEDCYLAMGGRGEEGIVEAVRQAMKQRFPNAGYQVPEGLDDARFFAFAYLVKSLSFQQAFDRLDGGLQLPFQDAARPVAAFGFDYFAAEPEAEALGRQATILDYRNDDDFILSLNTLSAADEIVLAKVPPGQTLRETVTAVRERIANSELVASDREFRDGERLVIPIIDFAVERTYQELTGKPLLNPGWQGHSILVACQGIRLRLDEWGARLESYGVVAACESVDEPRHFVFDKPFLLYMKEKAAEAPYLVMWIETAELLERIDSPSGSG